MFVAAMTKPNSTGGYNNLTNWPSIANRPTYSGGTLSWIGPLGGGPSTATDIPQSHALSTHSGLYTTSTNGETVEYLDITGGISIVNTGVTVQYCRIRGNGLTAVLESDSDTAFVIQDCLIEPNGSQQNGINMGYGNTDASPESIMYRCNVNSFENFITAGNRFKVYDTWFNTPDGADCDQLEQDSNNPESYCRYVYLQHNTFDGGGVSGFINAGVNFTQYTAANASNHNTVTGNCFINMDGDPGSKGLNLDIQIAGGSISLEITNNGFYNCSIICNTQDRGLGTITKSPNSGNFNMASTTATSGTPVNGTGQV